LKRAPAQVVIPFVRCLLLGEQEYNKIVPLLVGFESVRWLHITDLFSHSLNTRALSALFCNFSTAVEVQLDVVTLASASQLIRFIGFKVDLSDPTTLHPSSHLCVLELDDTCIDAVLDWFLTLPDRPALRAVGLHTIHSNNSESIANLLSTLENSLEIFLISTAIAQGMFVISSALIAAARQLRTALAVRPPARLMLALHSN
jgi:hypothetical protein